MRMSWLFLAALLVFSGCEAPTPPDGGSAEAAPEPIEEPSLPAVALPDDLPEDIPIYFRSTPVHVGTSEGGIRQSAVTSIQLRATDTKEVIHEFYAAAMLDEAWVMDLSTETLLHGKKGDRYLHVTISDIPDSPGMAQISVVYSRPETADDEAE